MGDIRVQVRVADVKQFTIITGVAKDVLVPYKTTNGESYVLVEYGDVPAPEVATHKLNTSTAFVQVKRLAGAAALCYCLAPLSEAIVEVLPVLSPLGSLGPIGFCIFLGGGITLAITSSARASALVHSKRAVYLCGGILALYLLFAGVK